MDQQDTIYTGPQAKIASLTGSPLWGLSIDTVAECWEEDFGFTLESKHRYPTPWGKGPELLEFVTQSGRELIWIPSYGGVKGEDWLNNMASEKVFWLLWKAGVRVLIIGGTSGTADTRALSGNRNAIEPGDFVLPWSFRTSPRHRGLPGTKYETAWPRNDLLLDEPFCTELSTIVADRVRKLYSPEPFRKVHTPSETRAALVIPSGITFETDFDIAYWMAITHTINRMQPGKPPVVTLHGDCVNPVLARLLGIHVMYYHLPCNWAQSLFPEVGITNTLYPLYEEVYPETVLELEAWMLSNLPIPEGDNCACVRSLHKAPEVFSKAMTQSKQ